MHPGIGAHLVLTNGKPLLPVSNGANYLPPELMDQAVQGKQERSRTKRLPLTFGRASVSVCTVKHKG